MVELHFADETFKIRGAVFEVNRVLGAGFLEGVYQEALALELAARRIPFTSSAPLKLNYKGVELKQTYVPDFICFDSVIVEIKAVRALAAEHRAQLMNYLRISGLGVGLLVNFGSYPKAQVERLAV